MESLTVRTKRTHTHTPYVSEYIKMGRKEWVYDYKDVKF